VCTGVGTHLLPEPSARVLVDRDYLFSALGTIATELPDEVRATFRAWVTGMDVAAGGDEVAGVDGAPGPDERDRP